MAKDSAPSQTYRYMAGNVTRTEICGPNRRIDPGREDGGLKIGPRQKRGWSLPAAALAEHIDHMAKPLGSLEPVMLQPRFHRIRSALLDARDDGLMLLD